MMEAVCIMPINLLPTQPAKTNNVKDETFHNLLTGSVNSDLEDLVNLTDSITGSDILLSTMLMALPTVSNPQDLSELESVVPQSHVSDDSEAASPLLKSSDCVAELVEVLGALKNSNSKARTVKTAKDELNTLLPNLQIVNKLGTQVQDNFMNMDTKTTQDNTQVNYANSSLSPTSEQPGDFEVMPAKSPPVNQQDVVRQIVEQAKLTLRPGQSEMVLRLRPEHLGELTLKISEASGNISAVFQSNNPEVRQVIEAALPQLKQDLGQQGIKIDTISVISDAAQFFDQGRQQQQQQSPIIKIRRQDQDFIQAVEEVDNLSTAEDGVDYRI